jgi:hypothetical protein
MSGTPMSREELTDEFDELIEAVATAACPRRV